MRVILGEMDEVKTRWSEAHRAGELKAVDRMCQMQTIEFARREADEPGSSLQSLLGSES